MKKRVVVILIISLIIILLAGIFAWFVPKQAACCGYLSGCGNSSSYQYALLNDDESGCLNISPEDTDMILDNYDNLCRERCLSSIALSKQNVSLCARITDVRNETKLKGPSERDTCYLNLAKNLSDSSICTSSETAWGKEFCPKMVDVQK